MPDLVNDPKYFGIDQPSMENPLHDDDPSNDYMFDEWKRKADLWREWAAKQDEAISRAVQEGAESGQDGDTTLKKLGFENRKEHGMHAFTMYGNNGYYANMGAAADPGWTYDWASGRKYNHGTADKYANGELGIRWVPINETERSMYRQAQQLKQQGLTDYGQQANSVAFKRAAAAGHFTKDPKSGNFFNVGAGDPNNPNTWEWKDQHGRSIGAPKGANAAELGNLYGGAPGGLPGGGGFGEGGGFPGGGGGMGGYPGFGMDSAISQFGLDRSMQSYLDNQARQGYLKDLFGSVLGVRFNPDGSYSRYDATSREGGIPGVNSTGGEQAPPPEEGGLTAAQDPNASTIAPGGPAPVVTRDGENTLSIPRGEMPEGAPQLNNAPPPEGTESFWQPGISPEGTEGLFLSPAYEAIGQDLQQAIARAKAEGRPQDVEGLIQSAYAQKSALRQGLQSQALGYLSSPDQYAELPGYLGELQANTQLTLGQMDDSTRRYLGDQQFNLGLGDQDLRRQLGMSDLELRRYLGEQGLSQSQAELDLRRQLGLLGDETARRGQDKNYDLAMYGYDQQDAQNKRNFYAGLGQAGADLLFGPGGFVGSPAAKIGGAVLGTGGAGGAAVGAGAGAGALLGGAALGALGGYGVSKITGGNKAGSMIGGVFGGPMGAVTGGFANKIGKGIGKAGSWVGKGIGKIFSDITVKDDVETYTPGLETLKMVDPITFVYTHESYGDTHFPTAGVSAQALEKIIPEAVETVVTPDGEKKMVDYNHILMTTVNAVKQLDDKMEQLMTASKYPKRKKGKK